MTAHTMNLEKLITGIPDGIITDRIFPPHTGPKEITVRGLTDRSNEVVPGFIFAAIPGQHHDGHEFIPEAIQQGAVAVIAEKPPENRLSVPVLLTPNSRLALSLAASVFFRHPSHQIFACGITGTNGKTTTSFMANTILETAGIKTGLIGTLYTKVGEELTPSEITTPEAPEVYALLARMVEERVTHVLLEVSSHSLEQSRVAGIHFDVGVVTNITRDHLDHHQDFDSYFTAKSKLAEMLAPHKTLLINADDEQAMALKDVTHARIMTFGLENDDADLTARKITHNNRGGTSFELCFTGELIDNNEVDYETAQELITVPRAPLETEYMLNIQLQVPGIHNVYNALAAAGIVLSSGLHPGFISRGLARFTGVKRRMETIYDGKFRIIDDFAHNPDSLRAVLAEISLLNPTDLVVVNAIRGNRGSEVNRQNAEVLARMTKQLGIREIISTLSRDHTHSKDRVKEVEKKAYIEGLEEHGMKTALFESLEGALREALQRVRPGGLILLLGAQGMDSGADVILGFIERNQHS